MKKTTLLAATAAASLFAGAASAETMASAIMDLNIRSGPGPQYDVIGVIGANDEAAVEGCLEDASWCKVSYNGTEGWSYSDYLTAKFDTLDQPVVLTERPPEAVPVSVWEVPAASMNTSTTTTTTTTEKVEASDDAGDGALSGAATGAIAGALIAGPVGAAVGGAAGAVTGGTVDAAITPPDKVVTYVQTNKTEPVYLDGEVVLGAGVPETVTITPIPDYDYQYAYVNRQPVLVDPQSRRIVYVIR